MGRCNELGFTDAQGYYDLYKGNNIVTITSEEQWHDILNNKTPMTREESIRKFSRDNKNFYQDNYDLTAAARAREKIQRDLKKLNAMIRQVQAKQKQEEEEKAKAAKLTEEEKAEQFAKGWKEGWNELLINNVAWTLKNGECKRSFYANKSGQPQGTSSKWLPPPPSQKGTRRGRQRDDEKLDERTSKRTKQPQESRQRAGSVGRGNTPERPWQSSKSATEY